LYLSNILTHKLETFLLFQKQQYLTVIGIKLYSNNICYRERPKLENIDIYRWMSVNSFFFLLGLSQFCLSALCKIWWYRLGFNQFLCLKPKRTQPNFNFYHQTLHKTDKADWILAEKKEFWTFVGECWHLPDFSLSP